jgi:hypothetical protein
MWIGIMWKNYDSGAPFRGNNVRILQGVSHSLRSHLSIYFKTSFIIINNQGLRQQLPSEMKYAAGNENTGNITVALSPGQKHFYKQKYIN